MAFPPRISGRALQALAAFSRTRGGASLLNGVSRRDMRIGALADVPASLLGETIVDTRPIAGRPPRAAASAGSPRRPRRGAGRRPP